MLFQISYQLLQLVVARILVYVSAYTLILLQLSRHKGADVDCLIGIIHHQLSKRIKVKSGLCVVSLMVLEMLWTGCLERMMKISLMRN